jgi:hypothetical protein
MTTSNLLHFDTINANLITDSAGLVTPFKCSFNLKRPLKKIKSISLKSVEMPILFPNIRSSNTSYAMTIYFVYTPYASSFTVKPLVSANASMSSVTDINYTSITTLLNDLNTYTASVITAFGGLTMSFSVDAANRIIITTNAQSVNIPYSILSNNILGFPIGTQTITSGKIVSTNFYNLSYDNYLTMHIYNLPLESNNVNGNSSTFQIPLDVTYQQVLYYDENNKYKQIIPFTDDAFVLNAIYVQIYDRFGYTINPYNGNFSFTLEIMAE